jgi:hypothetical protein
MVAVAYLPLQGVRLNASSIIVVQNGCPSAIVSGVRLIDLVEALLIDSGAFFFYSAAHPLVQNPANGAAFKPEKIRLALFCRPKDRSGIIFYYVRAYKD